MQRQTIDGFSNVVLIIVKFNFCCFLFLETIGTVGTGSYRTVRTYRTVGTYLPYKVTIFSLKIVLIDFLLLPRHSSMLSDLPQHTYST